jgi:hypothetical protein
VEQEIEGFVGEVVPYEPPAPPASLFGTSDPTEVIQKASEVAAALKDVITKKQLFSKIQGKDHVRVEGWQLLGSMLGISAVCVGTETVEGGWKATVEARRMDGMAVGRADAVCTRKENQWKNRDDYALLSMAQTRATSKALRGPLGFVVSLAGYSATPAEEVGDVPENLTQVQATPLDWGDDEVLADALKASFKALGYTKGKVKLVLAGCHDQEDRQQLLDSLHHDLATNPS